MLTINPSYDTGVCKATARTFNAALGARDDVIVLAGKGHETYQIRGTIAYPFDEREIVRELAAESSIRLPLE